MVTDGKSVLNIEITLILSLSTRSIYTLPISNELVPLSVTELLLLSITLASSAAVAAADVTDLSPSYLASHGLPPPPHPTLTPELRRASNPNSRTSSHFQPLLRRSLRLKASVVLTLSLTTATEVPRNSIEAVQELREPLVLVRISTRSIWKCKRRRPSVLAPLGICGLFHNHDEYSCPMMKLKHGGSAANMVSTAPLSFSASFPPSNFFQNFCQRARLVIPAIDFSIGFKWIDSTMEWIEQASEPKKEAVIKALIGAKEAMLGIRYHMRLMGEAAESQTKLLDATLNLEGVLLAGVPGAGGFDAVFAVTLGDSSSNVTKTWSSLNVLALLVKEDPCGVFLESADPRTNEITSAVSSIHIE
ncbi:Phosphomevalonate kinase [Arachis hypogaea]|nr:Phosphomevalonate kinase [Arachis hypogaea]